MTPPKHPIDWCSEGERHDLFGKTLIEITGKFRVPDGKISDSSVPRLTHIKHSQMEDGFLNYPNAKLIILPTDLAEKYKDELASFTAPIYLMSPVPTEPEKERFEQALINYLQT